MMDEDARFEKDTMIGRVEDVLRLVSAEFNDDEGMMKAVLGRYSPQLHDYPDVQDFLSTSLSINCLLVSMVAQATGSTPEIVIDGILLEIT